jgi:formylglycine-generating enzyme required for sulfatase activity
VQDWWGGYSKTAAENPKGPEKGDARVLRGGAWNVFAGVLRVSDRYWVGPEYRNSYLGFRCAGNYFLFNFFLFFPFHQVRG